MTTEKNNPANKNDSRVLTLTRVFDAPRDLVFKAWTDPAHLGHWWGPRGFTNPICNIDAQPGGLIRIDMCSPEGTVYPMTGVYREIDAPRRIVFVSAALDEKGNTLFEILNTVTFDDDGGKTTLTVEARVLTSTDRAPQYLEGMEEGWSQSLERLGEYVAKL